MCNFTLKTPDKNENDTANALSSNHRSYDGILSDSRHINATHALYIVYIFYSKDNIVLYGLIKT